MQISNIHIENFKPKTTQLYIGHFKQKKTVNWGDIDPVWVVSSCGYYK